MKTKAVITLILSTALIGAGVLAADSKKAAKQLEGAKISLTAAVDIAEKHLSGKAISADLDSHRAGTTFEVEVYAKDRLYEVDVNAVDGSIVRVREDND